MPLDSLQETPDDHGLANAFSVSQWEKTAVVPHKLLALVTLEASPVPLLDKQATRRNDHRRRII
ncbi:MAG: hypothetical protein ACYT04_97565, partial [Nostoc sp.]